MTRAIAIALILSCLAGAAWAGPVGAETIRLGGTGGPLEAMRLAGEAFRKTHPQTNVAIVPGLGSRGGIKALQAGAVDVAVSATPAPAAEPGLMWVELGRTPIIFATASARPGVSVTTADLVEILSGRKTTWPDGSRLRVILRPNGDSDTAFLRAISPAMDHAVGDGFKLPGVKIAATDQDAADAIGSIPGALGARLAALAVPRARRRPPPHQADLALRAARGDPARSRPGTRTGPKLARHGPAAAGPAPARDSCRGGQRRQPAAHEAPDREDRGRGARGQRRARHGGDARGPSVRPRVHGRAVPHMDGLEATGEIRRHEAITGAARLPVIALTASAMKGDRERCRDAGMDGYLTKPLNIREVRALLDRRAVEAGAEPVDARGGLVRTAGVRRELSS